MSDPRKTPRHRSSVTHGSTVVLSSASPSRGDGRHRRTRAGSTVLRRTGLAVVCAGTALALIVPTTSAALPDARQTAVNVLASAGVGQQGDAGGMGFVGSAPTAPAAGKHAGKKPAATETNSRTKPAAHQKAAEKKRKAETPQQRAGLVAPLSTSTMTSPFGQRVSPITGQLDEMHTGQDFGAASGAPVKAAGAGTVKEAGWHAYGGGNRVVIDHGNGLWTSYNHMSAIDVRVGQKIGQGQLVGAVGSTGASTGPHLHFEVYVDGTWVDPLPYLSGTTRRS